MLWVIYANENSGKHKYNVYYTISGYRCGLAV